jgi:hypothetical protein
MQQSAPDRLAHLFEPMPLPRRRAILSLVCGGLALLTFGGVLAYATDSPDLHGAGVTRYWCALFLYYTVALGGAALLGAFPRLAQPRVKIVWLLLTAALAAVALFLRHSGRPITQEEWWPLAQQYLPGVIPVLAGMGWRGADRLRAEVEGLPVR